MARADDMPVDVVACDLEVFDPAARARHRELVAAVRASVVAVRELPGGYRYTLSAPTFVHAAEWAGYERQCCAFFDFRLEWLAGGEPALEITGPPGAREILADFAMAG